MFKTSVVTIALAGMLMLGACSKDGSAEKAGESMDSAVENATTGKVDKGDGMLEKTGEAIDDVTGRKDSDAADAIHDATDGDPDTKP